MLAAMHTLLWEICPTLAPSLPFFNQHTHGMPLLAARIHH